MRTALRARWLPRHLLMVAIVATMSLLGRWQWDVSQSQRGGMQNLLYAFQWWAMAALVIYGWWRLLRDDAHPNTKPTPGEDGAAPRRSSAQPTGGPRLDEDSWHPRRRVSTAELIEAQHAAALEAGEADEELDEYNDYLARLNARAENAR